MDATGIDIIYGGAGFIIGAVIVGLTFAGRLLGLERRNAQLSAQASAEREALERAGAEMETRFKATAHEVLAQNSEQFLQRAEEKLKAAQVSTATDLEKRQKAIADLVDPVSKTLKTMDEKIHQIEKDRVGAYAELQTHLKTMTEDQVRLRRETGALVQALRSPATRGQWGEMQLRRCLEMAGMKAGINFHEQVSANNSQRPDVIVRMSDGKNLIIDSKAPIDAYLDALKDGATDQERSDALDRHARHVRGHIKALGAKSYWEQFETPEMVVMFLPAESYFSAALERDPSLIEAGVNDKVIVASPTTLIALLKAVMYGWRQVDLADNARHISALGAELYERISTFTDHMGDVGKGLGRAIESYNKAVGSLDSRVLPSARKFEELGAAPQGRDILSPAPIDHAVRPLTNPASNPAPAIEEATPRKRLA